MPLHNLDPPKLCNGTRLLIKQFLPNCLNVTIATGPNKGEQAMIPRIPIIPSDTGLPVNFWRIQFPIKLCFAVTTSKSQGQSLKIVGVPFTRGQLYGR